MKSIFHLFAFDDTYGPGTDLAMALLGIFILSAAVGKKQDDVENKRLKTIADNQMKMVTALAREYGAGYEFNKDDSVYVVNTDSYYRRPLTIRNAEVSQLYTFGESLLFEEGSAILKPKGEQVMEALGRVIKGHAGMIAEIQIQGHADPTPLSQYNKYSSNIELASARATTVFNFFKSISSIDPCNVLMSIVSYGEFKPLQRSGQHMLWNSEALYRANDTDEERGRNRRIEIVLIYN